MNKAIKTATGETMLQAPDGAGLPREEGWFSPTVNPFLHGCCDCGLAHRVEYTLATEEGEELPLPPGARLALRFSRDEAETLGVRQAKAEVETVAALRLALTLKAECPPAVIARTTFDGVKIEDLDRHALLCLVAILAAGKPEEPEPSRIIRL